MIFDRAFFDRGIDRTGTACEKWDDRDVLREGDIPLWVADMDFACAPAIAEALKTRAGHPCYGYTMTTDEDITELLAFIKRRHGLSLLREDALMIPCVVTGLKLFIRAFSGPDDRVAILTPVYGPFTRSIEVNHRQVVRCALRADRDGRFTIDFDALRNIFSSGVRMLLLCNPHNPVSRCWTKDELQKLLELCRQYDVYLCSDEIHAEFVFKPFSFTSILHIAAPDDKVMCLMSASKTFNIAGLQQAYFLSPNHGLLDSVRNEAEASGCVSGNLFALAGTRAAFAEGDAWLDGLMEYLSGNLKTLKALVKEMLPFARLSPVEATYLAWLDLRAYDQSCSRLMDVCAQSGVALTSGTFFGPEGEGFMRLNFGCPESQLKEGVKRLRQAMSRL